MFDRAQLLKTAIAKNGLDDFGSDDFLEPLDILVDALNTEAKLNDFGRARAEATILTGLKNRLNIQQYVTQHPELKAQRIVAPVFIVGLPRTGTTALHHMLNQDTSNRTLRVWEGRSPMPPPETASYLTDPRIAKEQAGLDMTERFMPGFLKTHLIDAQEPDECYMLLNQSFMSVEFSAMFHVPTYADWLYENLCVRDSYAYHKLQLKILQSKHPGNWVLKAPFHQLGLTQILKHYPDAIIVQTHRAPMSFVASGCSFSELLRRGCSDVVDCAEVGRDWMDMLRMYTQAFESDREKLEPKFAGQFLDVKYDDFVASPFAAIEAIYKLRAVQLGDSGRQAMQRWIDDHPKGKNGKHEYCLEDYSISRDEVEALFGDYARRYGVGLD